jgi:hypothetical protein
MANLPIRKLTFRIAASKIQFLKEIGQMISMFVYWGRPGKFQNRFSMIVSLSILSKSTQSNARHVNTSISSKFSEQ